MSAISLSLYQLLGISTTATKVEIKAAYRKMARTCHPDVVAFPKKETSANEFMKIHSAYTTLSDPAERAYYDRQNFRQSGVSSASSNSATFGCGPAVYSRQHKWETDQCW